MLHLATVKGVGECSLTIAASDSEGIVLSLTRGEKAVLSRIVLGLKAGFKRTPLSVRSNPALDPKPLSVRKSPTDGGHSGNQTITFDDGASLVVEQHPSLDAFDVSIVGAPDSTSVEARFGVEELGPCFGLGHLMRQPWPLQDGALELGPFYVRLGQSTSGFEHVYSLLFV